MLKFYCSKRKLMKGLIVLLSCLASPLAAQAAAPVLLFSDIIDGPKTGLGDGLGSGAIVTIWGTNLGSSRFGSTISVDGKAPYIYYWKNADGKLPGGPAELYSYQKMQEIALSIPATAADGAISISVTVNGVTSNPLPFFVRAGPIYHVKTAANGGKDSNPGTWASPVLTMTHATDIVGLNTGAIIYVGDGVTEEQVTIGKYNGPFDGAANKMYALAAYPNSRVIANVGTATPPTDVSPIWNYGGNTRGSAYWIESKISAQGKFNTGDTDLLPLGRIIGMELTNDGSGYCPQVDWSLFATVNSFEYKQFYKFFGNYIHDNGCNNTTHQFHTLYITIRSQDQGANFLTEPAPDLGWNHLENNFGDGAFHVYDEGYGGVWTGTMTIHDNAVVDQVGVCFSSGFDYGYNSLQATVPIWVYNNLFVNCGKVTQLEANGNDAGHPFVIGIGNNNNANGLPSNKSQIRFYNNTTYGYGDTRGPSTPKSFIDITPTWGGTLDFRNNITVDAFNIPFLDSPGSAATSHSNNLWYSSFGQPAPAWDTPTLTSNPNFVGAPATLPVMGTTYSTAGDYRLQMGSPASSAGFNAAPTVTSDILGAPRIVPYSIGAYQFQSTAVSVAPAAPRGFVLK